MIYRSIELILIVNRYRENRKWNLFACYTIY